MGTSPDVGGRSGLGRPLQPEYSELEASAQVQTAKQGLALVKSTIDIPLTQLGGNLWRYEAHSAKPFLKAKVLVEVAHPELERPSPLEEEEFQRLLEELPLKLSMQLKRERRLPFEEREGKLVVFEEILRFIARALAWSSEVASIDPSLYQESRSKCAAAPMDALIGWMALAEELKEPALDSLIERARALRAAGVKERKRVSGELFKQIRVLLERERAEPSGKLEPIAAHLIRPLASVAACLAEQSAGYFVFEALLPERSELLELTEEALASFPSAKDPAPYYLKRAARLAIGGFFPLVYAASGARSGAGGATKRERLLEKSRLRSLAIELASVAVAASRALPLLFSEALSDLPLSSKEREAAAEGALSCALHALLIAASAESGEAEKGGLLFEALIPFLRQAGLAIKPLADGMEEGSWKRALQTAVGSCLLALEKRSADSYFEALKNCFSRVGIDYGSAEEAGSRLARRALALLEEFRSSREQELFNRVISQSA